MGAHWGYVEAHWLEDVVANCLEYVEAHWLEDVVAHWLEYVEAH